jgi:hypothetical protein
MRVLTNFPGIRQKKFAKLMRKLLKTPKLEIFLKKVGRIIPTVSEIVQTKKSQSSTTSTDFSAAPKRSLIVTDVCVCYVMMRIVVNLFDNEFASSKFQVPFLKRKERFL